MLDVMVVEPIKLGSGRVMADAGDVVNLSFGGETYFIRQYRDLIYTTTDAAWVYEHLLLDPEDDPIERDRAAGHPVTWEERDKP